MRLTKKQGWLNDHSCIEYVIYVIQEKCSKALSSSGKWLSMNKPIKHVLEK
ncbi:hypothetical protein HanRHA438_Chr13g0591791 [Helianthus annuus]|nr:hypothetical protein HanRHA438_Chr13g0591791 [Helianthus annuus]